MPKKKRKRIAQDSSERVKKRREQCAQRNDASRSQETEQETVKRLADQAERQSSSRSQETEQETVKRLADQAERQSSSRSQETEQETVKRLADKAERQSSSRSQETEQETVKRLADQAERQSSSRSQETEQETVKRLADKAERQSSSRSQETEQETVKRLADQADRQSSSRSQETEQETVKRLADKAERQSRNRTQNRLAAARVLPPKKYRACHTLDAVQGIQEVDFFSVGPLLTPEGVPCHPVCQHCHAVKWKGEPPAMCCSNGAVSLPAFPEPSDYFAELLQGDSYRALTFRRYIRQLNNALTLASLKFRTPDVPGKKFTPSVIVQGKVAMFVGTITANEGKNALFSQLYVLDPDHADCEKELRLRSMRLPADTTRKAVNQLTILLEQLQNELRNNCYVKSFMTAAEVMARDKSDTIQLIIDETKRPQGEHARIYNSGTKEISVLTHDAEPGDRAIVLNVRGPDKELKEIPDTHRAYDPLHFILLFPTGEDGWHLGMTKAGDNAKRITALQYYAYHLQIRYWPNIPQIYPLHRGGRLFQEYICIAFAKVENQRLTYVIHNQKQLRCEKYSRLYEDFHARDGNDNRENFRSGRQVILPPSHMGSPRDKHCRFQNSMAICHVLGRPDFFLTFTCNSQWPEILQSILPGQDPFDRPDIMARVFHLKYKELLRQITVDKVLGERAGIMNVIEFQKRGLPHAHILLILMDKDRLRTANDIDNVISAELPPDPSTLPAGPERERAQKLLNLVTRHMVHTCTASCKDPNNVICKKGFPKTFCEETEWEEYGHYPRYRRRKTPGRLIYDAKGNQIFGCAGKPLDNRWIVPYNPFFLLQFECHFNTEACMSEMNIKYVYKYVTKGPDRAMAAAELDEVKQYQDMRSIGSSEGSWRLYKFPLMDHYPAVMPLRIHLPGEQYVMFAEGEEEATLAEGATFSELDAFFDYNNKHPDTRVRYVDFPMKFTWKQGQKCWKPRQKNPKGTIGRLHTIHPMAGDEFYLRILLHNDHCKGASSFADLRTVDGIIYETYKKVCFQLGLLQDDNEWNEALIEADFTNSCPQIRSLFVMILLFCEPSEPRLLFDNHVSKWADDFQRKFPQATPDQLKICVLIDIEDKLRLNGKNLEDFNLESVDDVQRNDHTTLTNTPTVDKLSVIMQEEQNFDLEEVSEQKVIQVEQLTPSQRLLYEEVMEAVENEPVVFFVSARGGTGKTFTLKTILSACRSRNGEKNIALAVASSGIAATLLPLGRTTHSRFRVPLNPEQNMSFAVKPNDAIARAIIESIAILWDEEPMLHRYIVEGLDRLLRDIMQVDKPFGGKVIVLAGDFRQVLPVIKHGSRSQISDACLQKSYLWRNIKVMELTENMRLSNDPEALAFDQWLLHLGNGTLPIIEEPDKIQIPPEYVFDIDDGSYESTIKSMESFASLIYPDLVNRYAASSVEQWLPWIAERAILAPKNTEVDRLNDIVCDLFPGESVTVLSADSTVEADDATRFPTEFLNSLSPSGLAPHELKLKKGMVLILLRNLNPRLGLCNGTRLILEKASKRLLQCKLATGDRAGEDVLVPRIDLTTNDADFPFKWRRRQFPVRPAFAMTINKSQGQTLNKVGIWLFDPVFTHGQLYVAASRIRHPSNLHIAIKQSDNGLTRNIVFDEVIL